MKMNFITGTIQSSLGQVPVVSSKWSAADKLGAIKVRWSLGRSNYTVTPGLYAIGIPNANSTVFISANYKLSFDHLRCSLSRINAWILVIDTKGINVWCAAGKGTFGSNELIYRIRLHEINKVVSHKNIIVPQLGAVGVSAHEVKKQSGFNVIYGPVNASDIQAFVTAGYKATPEMRIVKFPFIDRLKLIPVELTYGKYYLLFVPALFFILSGFSINGYSIDKAWTTGSNAVLNLFFAFLAGSVIVPALLPWIPFRSFSLKGLLTGWLIFSFFFYFHLTETPLIESLSLLLINGSVSSFLAMNFTGASTFTSLSGVQKEMKLALPLQITASALGILTWIVSLFL